MPLSRCSGSNCATLCGADDWVTVEQFGRANASWFGSFLELPNGIPAHDTFSRVFRFLDAACFEQCFIQWVGTLRRAVSGELIAVAGKQLRRSPYSSEGKAAIHLVSAWARANQLVLGQTVNDNYTYPRSPRVIVVDRAKQD